MSINSHQLYSHSCALRPCSECDSECENGKANMYRVAKEVKRARNLRRSRSALAGGELRSPAK
jgi:hypothetical protein